MNIFLIEKSKSISQIKSNIPVQMNIPLKVEVHP